jgi:ribosome-binding protein aMBF1 (putative translation factor)
MTKTGMRHAVLVVIRADDVEDDELFCEACGKQIEGAEGRSVEFPGIPAGEIIVCKGCAGRLEAEAGGAK